MIQRFIEVILINQQVKLRKILMSDVKELVVLCKNNKDFFRQFDFIAPKFESSGSAKQTIKSLIKREKKLEAVSYLIIEKNMIVGQVTVNKINWSESWADIGYWLAEQSIGRGLALMAVGSLLNYLHDSLKIQKIVATTAVSNFRSQKLLTKLGFTQAKLIRGAVLIHGKEIDDYEYVKLKRLI
ncbi:MAG: GNAT family N-acetyltransferase [Candidatus Cloacimonetes bacterium]|nr:GNAT family N-acetyltransferase [Candidatus Cloacimonadota bacterium]